MKKTLLLLSVLLLFFSGCLKEERGKTKPKLLIYSGTTMVKPMTELARNFEKMQNVEIKITQGGSKDLYESLKASRVGDLYLPGCASFRENNLKDTLLKEHVVVGENRASLVVYKGNPKKIKGELQDLANPQLDVVLGNPESGSIGRETKNILKKLDLDRVVFENAKFLTADSRNLIKALKDREADIVINWYATTKWSENRDFVEAIAIDEKYAPKKKLILNALTFSKNPQLTKKFLEYAGSKEGLALFKKYGF